MATHVEALNRPGDWFRIDEDLRDWLEGCERVVTEDKKSVPLFLGADIAPGGRRCNADVTAMRFAVLDFDGAAHLGMSDDDATETLERLSTFDCYVATSHSHRSGANKFRAVLRFSRDVRADEWPRVFALLGAVFPGRDPECPQWSQSYFYPSCPSEREGHAWAARINRGGPDFNPDGAVPPDAPRPPGTPLSRESLDKLIKRMRGSDDPAQQSLGTRLLAVRDGIAFAEPGARDTTLFAIVLTLCRQFRDLSLETLWSTLAQSLDVTFTDGEHPDIAGKYARARKLLSDQEESIERPKGEVRIDPAILTETFAVLGVDDPDRAMVVQHDRDYYVASHCKEHGLQYIPCAREVLLRQCKDKLKFTGVKFLLVDGDRIRAMTVDEFVDRHCTPVESVSMSFGLTNPEIRRFGQTRELVLPATVRRWEHGAFDSEVNDWLKAMGGDLLLDWIVLAQDPVEQLAALVLIGAPGTGKSLLAKEMAKIWTRHAPPTLTAVLNQFNGELIRCPIILSDEEIPRDRYGHVRTAEIRDMIQKGRHAIDAKFKAISHLELFPRIVIAANNDGVLDFGSDSLTADDLDAIQQRLRVINVPTDCASMLEGCDVKAWLADSRIARHAIWLAETRAVERVGRFGLPLTTGAVVNLAWGLRGQIFEWLVKHLAAPGRVRTATVVDTAAGVVRLRISDLDAAWTAYLDSARPSPFKLQRSMQMFPSSDGAVTVPFDAVRAWAVKTNYVSADELSNLFAGYNAQRAPLRAVQ